MATPDPRVTVVGIGADGWSGLPAAARDLVTSAAVLLGGNRHLDLVPPVEGQQRVPWPSPLRTGLPALLASLPAGPVVALASGDPLVSGIGSTLIDLLGSACVDVVPAVSSVALARARMGWSAESCEVVTLVGRDPRALLARLSPGRRLIVLTSTAASADEVAALLRSVGYDDSGFTVLGDLGSADESVVHATAATWPGGAPDLHVLALTLQGPPIGSLVAGLPDEAFETDGQITRRDVRIGALARLAPQPGHLLWDVGAGSGAVGIEWMRAHPTCRTIAVEPRADRAERVGRNAAALGVPGLEVVVGAAPAALADLPIPDAIFVGGGATTPGLLEACVAALPVGGRLVMHGVTWETERLLMSSYSALGGEMVRFHVEPAAPLGGFTGWQPTRAITQWAWTKPSTSDRLQETR